MKEAHTFTVTGEEIVAIVCQEIGRVYGVVGNLSVHVTWNLKEEGGIETAVFTLSTAPLDG